MNGYPRVAFLAGLLLAALVLLPAPQAGAASGSLEDTWGWVNEAAGRCHSWSTHVVAAQASHADHAVLYSDFGIALFVYWYYPADPAYLVYTLCHDHCAAVALEYPSHHDIYVSLDTSLADAYGACREAVHGCCYLRANVFGHPPF